MGITLFLGQVADCCASLRSVWKIGGRTGDALDSSGPFGWDLVAFADRTGFLQLQHAVYLHRSDVMLRVVTDGDRYEMAWGGAVSGSLRRWEWREESDSEAYYFDPRGSGPARAGNHMRPRRRAVCLWRGADPAS